MKTIEGEEKITYVQNGEPRGLKFLLFILLFISRFVRGYLCPDMKGLNEESISVLLTLIMIIGYLFIGILHGKMDEADDRTIGKIHLYFLVRGYTISKSKSKS